MPSKDGIRIMLINRYGINKLEILHYYYYYYYYIIIIIIIIPYLLYCGLY